MYTFNITDHLGNVRAVVNQDGMVVETNDYYPFGMLMNGGATSVQPFKYCGKELDRMHGLNWYDHGARMSDPALCRWHVVDPLCEKYYDVSTYVMCANDPVNFVDKDGREIFVPNKNDRQLVISMLNQLSASNYTIDNNGYLHIDNTQKENGQYSQKYANRIKNAIESKDGIIEIRIGSSE